jgi:hypothetical protein
MSDNHLMKSNDVKTVFADGIVRPIQRLLTHLKYQSKTHINV